MKQKTEFWSNSLRIIESRASLWAVPVVLSLLLLIVSRYNFLAFHTLAELFSIIISFVLFAVAWSTDKYRKNAFLIILACGYFWIGALDLAHTLLYKGMNVVTEGSGNLSSQFWIGTRYIEAAILALAPLAAVRAVNRYYIFVAIGLIATGLFFSISIGAFPTTFSEATGLTSFKIYSEFVIIAILIVALVTLHQKRRDLSRIETKLITAGIILTILGELMFTMYVDVYGAFNLVGHVFKIASFWMIFQAVVVTNLLRPFEALAESRDYNRQLFETSSIGLALAQMDGTLIDVNPAYAKIIGRSVEDTLGLTYWHITPEKYAAKERVQLESLKTTGRYGPYIKEYIHRDGHLVPVQLSGSIIQHNGGSYIWSTVEDISSRIEAETIQAKQGERLEKLTAHLPGFIYQFRLRPDGSSHFPYASDGIRHIYGCAPEDVVDDAGPVFKALHPEDLIRVSRSIQESAETLQPWSDEYRVILPDGDELWIEGHASPIKEDDGSITWHGYIQDVSERVATRDEIMRQRDRLRTYLDMAGTLVLALNRDGTIILINAYACKLLGYEQQDLIGKNWFDLALPLDIREEVRRGAKELFAGRSDQFATHENEILTSAGERRLISWNNTCVRNDTGEIDTLLTSGIDITIERRSQLELELSNRALRTISHCNEALVHATNEEQLLNNICRVIVEEGGYQMAWTAFIRHNNGAHLIPTSAYGPNKDVVDAVLADIKKLDLLTTSKPLHFSPDAGAHHLPNCAQICEPNDIAALYMLPLKDAGAPFGALFITRDSSKIVDDMEWALLEELAGDLSYGIQALRMERERAYVMEKLAESEERSLAIVESAHDAIIAIDRHGMITQFNPAAQAMFGYTRQEALGSSVNIIIPERYRHQHDKSVRQYAKTGKSHIIGKNLTLEGLRSNGHEFPIELTLSQMPANTSDLCTAIIRDASDREEAERQRRQAQNMESLGNLAGGMAHDINNMLLPILNLTAMVKRTLKADSKEDEKLSMVLQAAERVKDLVERVLEFSRQDEPDFKDQNIREIVEEALPLIQTTTATSIKITPKIADVKGAVFADKKQISAALINLVSNAADAIGGANGHIAIELSEAKPSQNMLTRHPDLRAIPYAKISVADDGCGMSKEILERIFNPFFTTKEPGKGTGLGMSMVHGIVTKHGGVVDVHSTEGEGSQIDLYLPLKAPPFKYKSTTKKQTRPRK